MMASTSPTTSPDAPCVGILALQGDVREHAAHMHAVGARTAAVRTAADLDGIDGLIIPGGESTAISRLIRVFAMEQPLRDYLRTGKPVYGSCAGMILLARHVLDTRADAVALDGLDITVRRNAFGRQVDSFETDLHFAAAGTVHAVFIRAPWVESVGKEATVLAAVDDGTGTRRPVAVQQGNTLVTSFHPEVTDDLTIHRHFLAMIVDHIAACG